MQETDQITPSYSLKDFVAALERPRKIILMVKAGTVVDLVTDGLLPYLKEGDIVIDAGNSFYKDTERRMKHYAEKGIKFFGMGVSGGEKGALLGPSIMPSGNKDVFNDHLKQLLKDIAAHTTTGDSCCDYIGKGGSGHYVKMVHNGIEYGDMQIINEAYFMLKNVCGFSNAQIADVFEDWNRGRLQSYLVEITSKILRVKDPCGTGELVDAILDEAGQKGTGMWTAMDALEKHQCVPTMCEAVFARNLSAQKDERVYAAHEFDKQAGGQNLSPKMSQEEINTFITDLEQAVYASKIMSYAQGFSLLQAASDTYQWNLDLGNIALLWREGCIIRAVFLERIKRAYDEGKVVNLMLTDEFKDEIKSSVAAWRRVVIAGIAAGLYVPTIANSLLYFDGYTSEKLPANLCQAQRDWFGAHTFKRVDKPRSESFHHIWEQM
ncbi:6-phosphogluconate dehydrogenase%2Cdecarboxylating [Chlamydia trachomatis]|nr:6-phosphogluconate dehydrogenase%2Cdecarboxylating [Chlamydia trachomatis]